MPEEIEIPTEHLHEEIQEKAEEQREKWTLYVALSTALMAVLAAVAGLLAGHHANEALIERVKASDQWNFYQAKNLKAGDCRQYRPDPPRNGENRYPERRQDR